MNAVSNRTSAGLRGSAAQRRRVAFFFDDYFDPEARMLEIGPGDGWLGPYLNATGFHGYLRLNRHSPADFVGELENWNELGLAPASFEILIAFDGLPDRRAFAACFALLAPGGRLFLVAPRPGRGGLVRLLSRLGLRRWNSSEASAFDPAALGGFRVRKRRRAGVVDDWLSLQKPLDSSSEIRIES